MYVSKQSVLIDIRLVHLTILAIFSREKALKGLCKLLEQIGVPKDVIKVSRRESVLVAFPPPGSDAIVTSR